MMYVLLYVYSTKQSSNFGATPNPSVNRTPGKLRLPVPSALRAPVAAERKRYAAVGWGHVLRGAQQRMIKYGQDIPAQGTAEVL